MNTFTVTSTLTAGEETDLEKIEFSPPLYLQRYLRVAEIIEKFKPNRNLRKIVDIGCAELSFFKFLKEMDRVEEVILFDMDLPLLKEHTRKVRPLAYDFVIQRKNPMRVSVICGDATFLHPSLLNANVITMIEFIEHLQEVELPSIVNNIFGIIQPGLVIITTPNADYNKHFPGFKTGQFRHHDHKFEWTDEQFRKWCMDIAKTYEYFQVYFSGCGEDKDGMFCSQIGIFYHENHSLNKTNNLLLSKSFGTSEVLSPCEGCMLPWRESKSCKILLSIEYPHDSRSKEQICIDYIRSSLYELYTWLRHQLDSTNYDFPFQVDYNHPYSYEGSNDQTNNPDQPTEGNEHLNSTKSTAFELFESLSNEEESCESISSQFENLGILNENNKGADSDITKGCHDNILLKRCNSSMQMKYVSNENYETDSKNSTSSKKFNFVAVEAEFQASIYDDLFEKKSTFYYLESKQVVFFTSTTFCLWTNLLANNCIILETLGKEKIITLCDADEKIIQLSLDQDDDDTSSEAY